jgi:hypothetical protein
MPERGAHSEATAGYRRPCRSRSAGHRRVLRVRHEPRELAMAQELPLTDELSAAYARLSGMLLSEETTATATGMVTSLAAETIPDAVEQASH